MSWLEGGEKEELHRYMIFVTLKESSSLGHEIIVPINLIKLIKNQHIYCKCSKQKEGFIYKISIYRTLQLQMELIHEGR